MVHVEMRREEKGRNRRVYRSFLYVGKLTLSVCRHYIYRYVLLLELDNHYPKHICGLNFNVMYHRTLKSRRVSCVRQRGVCYAGCVHWKKKTAILKRLIRIHRFFFYFSPFTESTFLDTIMTIQLTKSWCEWGWECAIVHELSRYFKWN